MILYILFQQRKTCNKYLNQKYSLCVVCELLFCLNVKCMKALLTTWIFNPIQLEQYIHCVPILASVDGSYLLLL